ncbi:hypothetical protein INR49_005173, partial [Caranx melampygus]
MFKRGGRLFHNDTEAEVENESEEKGKQETGGGSENSGDRDVEARRITRLVSGSTLAHAELTEQLKPKSEKKKKKEEEEEALLKISLSHVGLTVQRSTWLLPAAVSESPPGLASTHETHKREKYARYRKEKVFCEAVDS